MKNIYLFASRLRLYLSEVLPIFILIIAIKYNDGAAGKFKLYPLQIAMVLVTVFIFIYLFRALRINVEELRCIGLFSSHDSVIIKKDRSLVLSFIGGLKWQFEVFGDGEVPEFDWAKTDEYENTEINLFRTKAFCLSAKIKKILALYEVEPEDFSLIMGNDSFTKEYEFVTLSSELIDNKRKISLKFKKTI